MKTLASALILVLLLGACSKAPYSTLANKMLRGSPPIHANLEVFINNYAVSAHQGATGHPNLKNAQPDGHVRWSWTCGDGESEFVPKTFRVNKRIEPTEIALVLESMIDPSFRALPSMKQFFVLCMLLLGQFSRLNAASATAPSVELHWQGRQVWLSESSGQQLIQQALHLVESSNFHSDPGDKYHFFTLSGLQSDYRREVAGRYLLISFPTPQKLKTIGGEVTVVGIVVGLNRDNYASSLFTIDDSGRIIGHSKYAGELCLQIFNTVKKLNP